jgi:hypothetical protein
MMHSLDLQITVWTRSLVKPVRLLAFGRALRWQRPKTHHPPQPISNAATLSLRRTRYSVSAPAVAATTARVKLAHLETKAVR